MTWFAQQGEKPTGAVTEHGPLSLFWQVVAQDQYRQTALDSYASNRKQNYFDNSEVVLTKIQLKENITSFLQTEGHDPSYWPVISAELLIEVGEVR
jgi:hypothetical protein